MTVTTIPRLGRLDALAVRIIKDILLQMDDDPYLELFEDLVDIDNTDEDEEGNSMNDDAFMDELDRLEGIVLKRVGKALVNHATGKGDQDRLMREVQLQLKMQDDAETPENPHVVLIHAPAAHLVRQI